MNHAHKTNVKGFTIIELMLAMSFIAALLVAIAMTTIGISRVYTKGLTLREVNQVGRSASRDIQRSISASVPINFSATGPAQRYIKTLSGGKESGGRLCLGRYSYVWNYGSALRDGAAPHQYSGDSTSSVPHFVKVNDASASLCTNPATPVPKADSTELLASGDRNLVLHKLTLTSPPAASASGQALYVLSMTIGTNDQAQLSEDVSSCKPPSEGDGNEDYCAVNQFDIVVRAGNKSGEE